MKKYVQLLRIKNYIKNLKGRQYMSLMDVLTLNAKDYFDTVLDVYINFILLFPKYKQN